MRQVAPDARVLAIRIMHSDDVVYEGDLICALRLLANRIAAAEPGDLAEMVDVVSLSLGYFDESAADVSLQLRALAGDRGCCSTWASWSSPPPVTTRPAAGSTRRRSPCSRPRRSRPLISVGALNPNGSKALFSDGGRWVRPGPRAPRWSAPSRRRQRQPHPRGQGARAPGQPAARRACRCRPTARRSTPTTSAAGSPPGAARRSRPR